VDRYIDEFGSVAATCRAVGFSSSSYYYKPTTKIERTKTDADIRDKIETVQAKYPFYGHRRIHEFLERFEGLTVNKKKILRIMKQFGLKALIWRGFKVKTTDSNHKLGYADNLLPGMKITDVNQVWVTDITYIRILTGFVYLAAILDLFSRKVVGWTLSINIDHKLCLAALKDAVGKRRPKAGLIHHSDRGIQYACHEYRQYLKDHGIVESMSAQGYCYDNAFMESFWKTLKAEEVYLTEYETLEDVLKSIPTFIEDVYNKKRLHSSLGYHSPEEFEQLAEKGLLENHGLQPVIILG
jgi:transposase InsO family protein